MRPRTVIAWVAAALLGLALAAAITLAVSQLSSQRIGLSGEPISAGRELVPATTPTTTPPAPTTTRTNTIPPRPARPAAPARPTADDGGPGDD